MDGFSRSADRLRDVAGCVTHDRLVGRTLLGSVEDVLFQFGTPAPIRARGALRGSAIGVRVTLDAGGEVLAYAFTLLGPAGAELLAWHWHPTPEYAAPAFPHVHVSASLRIVGPGGERGLLPLDKRHLPTGPVSLAAFVRMLIEEFGVEPLARDWEARLAEA